MCQRKKKGGAKVGVTASAGAVRRNRFKKYMLFSRSHKVTATLSTPARRLVMNVENLTLIFISALQALFFEGISMTQPVTAGTGTFIGFNKAPLNKFDTFLWAETKVSPRPLAGDWRPHTPLELRSLGWKSSRGSSQPA